MNLAASAAAYIRAGTWDEAQAYFGLDQSFMWDDTRIVEQCKDYRNALAREERDARELTAYRAIAKKFAGKNA